MPWNWFEGVPGNLIAGVIQWLVPLVVALLLGYLKLKGSDLVQPVLYSLIGMLLVGLISLTFRLPELLRRQPAITTANVDAHIRDWLDHFKMSSGHIDVANAVFALVVTIHDENKVTVFRLQDKSQYVIVQAVLQFNTRDEELIKRLSSLEQKHLRLMLTSELAKLNVGFGIAMPNSITVVVRTPITDTFSEATFMESIDRVDNAMLVAKAVFNLEIDAARASTVTP
jgi:hypothetical protein